MRIRSVKPEFWRSEDIAALRRELRLLFIGLWSYVDDNGVGVDDHRQIAADLFALEDDPVGARAFVRDGLATLSAAGLVVRYRGPSKPLLYVPTWDKHQRVDRPGKPRHPRPDEDGANVMTSGNADGDGSDGDTSGSSVATHSRHTREGLAPGAGEQGSRGAGETDSSSPSARTARDDRRDRGTRVPDDFQPDPDLIEWAQQNAPTCGRADHEAFMDYWQSVPGQKGRKVDWRKTWRNWMRKEHERRAANPRASPNTNGQRPSTTDQRVQDGLALVAKYEQIERLEIEP